MCRNWWMLRAVKVLIFSYSIFFLLYQLIALLNFYKTVTPICFSCSEIPSTGCIISQRQYKVSKHTVVLKK